jgi:hypothetical protein
MIMKALAKLFARPTIRDWIIDKAMKTPYYHIMSPDGVELYMARYWLFNEVKMVKGKGRRKYPFIPFSIRVHRIRVPDVDRDLHDHPWNARTFILSGWYHETRRVERDPIDGYENWADRYTTGQFSRDTGTTATLQYGEYHRITKVSAFECWTMFVMGRFQGDWGFLVNGRKVPRWRYQARGPDKRCPTVAFGDRTICQECGAKWDTNDIEPPDCPVNDPLLEG